MILKDKHIILGITGSIAAYKAAYIIRGLVKKGAEVQVVITPAGKEFITPLTLSTLPPKQREENYENCTKFFNRIWRFGRALETCSISLFKEV